MANKTGKTATKSAKMRQDRPTWAAEANERRAPAAPPGPLCARSGPPRKKKRERKDQRVRHDLPKNLQRI